MLVHTLVAVLLLAGPAGLDVHDAVAKGSKAECQRGCNKRCSSAGNKAKCVGQCRRACR